MQKVVHQLVAGPVVGFVVGVGDGAVGQAQFGDRHDNVRSIYRLGVLAAGAVALATDHFAEQGLAAMTAAAALVGSRVVPAIQGGGWQQFGMVSRPFAGTGVRAPRGRDIVDTPAESPLDSVRPGAGEPGQELQNAEKQYRHLHGGAPI